MRKSTRDALTPDDWADAALARIAHGGIEAVAVESVATDLGATKGSFYWHFENREALIQAALDKWEERGTDAVIEKLSHEPDPAKRLRHVLAAAFKQGPADRAEISLLANPSHPAAVRAVRRVADRRIRYMAQQLEALGWGPREALDRAVLLAYVYVGYLQMAHVGPTVIDAKSRRRHVELVIESLVDGDPETD